MLVVVVVSMMMLTAVSVWATYKSTQNHSSVTRAIAKSKADLCANSDISLNVMTQILTAAQISTDTDPTVAAAKKEASDKFVVSMLGLIAKARC